MATRWSPGCAAHHHWAWFWLHSRDENGLVICRHLLGGKLDDSHYLNQMPLQQLIVGQKAMPIVGKRTRGLGAPKSQHVTAKRSVVFH